MNKTNEWQQMRVTDPTECERCGVVLTDRYWYNIFNSTTACYLCMEAQCS